MRGLSVIRNIIRSDYISPTYYLYIGMYTALNQSQVHAVIIQLSI